MSQRSDKYPRLIDLPWSPNPVTGSAAAFLWGPRQSGKTTLLRQRFPTARFYDLLDTTLSDELSVTPRLLREQILAEKPRVGVVRALHPEAREVAEGSDLYGRAYEHFLLNEVRAYLAYNRDDRPLTFWRTHSGFEVDLIVGDLDLALAFKSGRQVRDADFRGLRALKEEHRVRRSIIVARTEERRATEDGIEILPWRQFCAHLWDGAFA